MQVSVPTFYSSFLLLGTASFSSACLASCPSGRRDFARRTQHKALETGDEAAAKALTGWYLGSEEFKAELLAAMEGKAGPNHYGSERRETGEHRAKRLLQESLERANLSQNDLGQLPKGDPRKVEIAWQLRQNTSMTLQWIAKELRMGSWSYVHNLLAARRKTMKAPTQKIKSGD